MSHSLVAAAATIDLELQPSRSRSSVTLAPTEENPATIGHTTLLTLSAVMAVLAPNSNSDDTAPVIDNGTESRLGRSKIIILVTALAGVTFLASLCNAMIGIAAPVIAKDLHLDHGLLLW